LACAATAEYTQFYGGTVAGGLAAIATAVNRVTGVYESELGIRLVLVANNNLLVYTNTATDPYTDNNPSLLLSQNQSNLDFVIGNANYDIGHVFGTAGGGLAGVGVVCISGLKAHGETGVYPPTGDAFWIDYVSHEMGHQFGACHTFNSTTSGCNGNRNASTAYEPGSGSTIMAYAGICGGDNLQFNSDPYFHSISFDQIMACVTTGPGSAGGTISANANNPPTLMTGTNFIVPKGTPFTLTASGADPDGDALTWCWEERDLGPSISLATPDNGSSPLFRSFNPSASAARTFPQLSDVLNNSTTPGERLPATNRTLIFRVTARDNRAGGGCVATADFQVTVNASAGPFRVTSPGGGVAWSGFQTVAWNVASTTNAPINATNVCILLSTNGGLSFPIVLAANVPNTGSQTVLLPNVSTSSARIKVQAVGNIFFDISHTNFSITPSMADVAVSQGASGATISAGNSLIYTLRVTNLGPNVASGVTLNDPLPATFSLVSASANQGSCIFTNGLLTCDLGVLTNGATVLVTVSGIASLPGTLTNAVSVSANSSDPAVANNSAISFVTVKPVHNGPGLPAQADRVWNDPTILVVTNTALDNDIPTLALTYQLLNPSMGATIDANGIITWNSPQSLGPGTYIFQTVVTDNGNPRLSATNSFRVAVQVADGKAQPANTVSLSISNGIATLTWPATAAQTYRVQFKDSLATANWSNLSPDITATSSTATATDPISSSPQRFYRVLKLP
jgi:uncharacterized repeat protein (TIGR01451 family)